ncbi:MAG: LiaF domain-containing protein [bacterium]
MTEPYRSSLVSSVHSDPLSSLDADEARERAIRLLTDAYAYDVITDFEFERRLSQLGLSATRASIDAAVADLPAAGSVARQTTLSYAPSAQHEGKIVGFMSETRRKGPWRVPQHLTIRAIMCDMKVDLRYAAIPPGCIIEVKSIMSSVSIIVPPAMVVSFHVDPILGAAGSSADGGLNESAAHVHVHGSAIMSDVRVRVRQLGR